MIAALFSLSISKINLFSSGVTKEYSYLLLSFYASVYVFLKKGPLKFPWLKLGYLLNKLQVILRVLS